MKSSAVVGVAGAAAVGVLGGALALVLGRKGGSSTDQAAPQIILAQVPPAAMPVQPVVPQQVQPAPLTPFVPGSSVPAPVPATPEQKATNDQAAKAILGQMPGDWYNSGGYFYRVGESKAYSRAEYEQTTGRVSGWVDSITGQLITGPQTNPSVGRSMAADGTLTIQYKDGTKKLLNPQQVRADPALVAALNDVERRVLGLISTTQPGAAATSRTGSAASVALPLSPPPPAVAKPTAPSPPPAPTYISAISGKPEIAGDPSEPVSREVRIIAGTPTFVTVLRSGQVQPGGPAKVVNGAYVRV
ncbi:MAG TPA: hypothetical protein VGK74_22195 [Symbiobacteriaceae bacterium]